MPRLRISHLLTSCLVAATTLTSSSWAFLHLASWRSLGTTTSWQASPSPPLSTPTHRCPMVMMTKDWEVYLHSLTSSKRQHSRATRSKVKDLGGPLPSFSTKAPKSTQSKTLKDHPIYHQDLPTRKTDKKKVRHPIWQEADLTRIFDNNRKWVAKCLAEDPDYFSKLKNGQQPEYLFIGCSDSRVPAQEIMGLKAGEVFVARNVANMVVSTDISLLTALHYSVHVLEVKDIFVCGHYGCGGVKAATMNVDHGIMEPWLRSIRDVQRLHKQELDCIEDEEERWNKLVELNVQEQCINLFANPIVQRKQVEKGFPRVHGMVYDVGTGYLRKLDIDFQEEIRKYRDIYQAYDFKHKGIMTQFPENKQQSAPVPVL